MGKSTKKKCSCCVNCPSSCPFMVHAAAQVVASNASSHVASPQAHAFMCARLRAAGCFTLGNLWKTFCETCFSSAVCAEETDWWVSSRTSCRVQVVLEAKDIAQCSVRVVYYLKYVLKLSANPIMLMLARRASWRCNARFMYTQPLRSVLGAACC